MTSSTWNGLRWWGDKLSQQKIKKNETGFSKSITKNMWLEKLGLLEKLILKYLLYERLIWYRYEKKFNKNTFLFIIIFFGILVPTRYERSFLSINKILNYIRNNNTRIIFASFYYYLLRVLWFYKILLFDKKYKNFTLPYFNDY